MGTDTPAARYVAPAYDERSLTDLLSLAGRVAVVTGGGRGIGAATVRRLAEAGATVIAADLDAGAAAEAADSAVPLSSAAARSTCRHRVPGRRRRQAVTPTTAASTCGSTTPASTPPPGRPSTPADELIDRMLQVNLRGTFAGAREAARRMTGGGVIVNVVSTAGFRAATGISAYVASKHAVVGLTKNLALELGPPDPRRRRRPRGHRHAGRAGAAGAAQGVGPRRRARG